MFPGSIDEALSDLLTRCGCAELRIHDEIERGSNDSIKKGSNLAAAATGLCDG